MQKITILELRNVFFHKLSSIYPKTEIDSFFYMLMQEYLSLKRVDVILQLQEKITVPVLFNQALEALAKEQPIQYILEKTFFYGLELEVAKNVLIPRPETEELVDWIISDNEQSNDLKVLDIGTGSGCIAISLAKNIKNSKISAIDISKDAISLATKNAINNDVEIDFIQEDILISKGFLRTWDIIVSNPPYVRELEKKEMQKNVLEYEPHLALFVKDSDPLLFYNTIANFALSHLSKKGSLYFEINQYLALETVDLLKNKGFKNIELREDIFKNKRMLKANL